MLIRDKCIAPGNFFKEFKEKVILSILRVGGDSNQNDQQKKNCILLKHIRLENNKRSYRDDHCKAQLELLEQEGVIRDEKIEFFYSTFPF